MYIVGIDSMDVLVLAAENQKVSDKNKRLKGDLQTLSGAYNETLPEVSKKDEGLGSTGQHFCQL